MTSFLLFFFFAVGIFILLRFAVPKRSLELGSREFHHTTQLQIDYEHHLVGKPMIQSLHFFFLELKKKKTGYKANESMVAGGWVGAVMSGQR